MTSKYDMASEVI